MLIPFGFLASAGGAAGSYELISTTVLGGTQTTVTFTSAGVWAGYKHLQLRMVARLNGSDRAQSRLTLNSDTGVNYRSHQLYANGSAVSSFDFGSNAYILTAPVPGSLVTASVFGSDVVDFLDANSTTKNKTTRSFGGFVSSTAKEVTLSSGLWMSTAAMSTISVTAGDTRSFVAGSRFSLYGIKG